AIGKPVALHLLRPRRQSLDWKVRVELRDALRDARHERLRIGRRQHVEVDAADALVLPVRDEEERRDLALHVAVLRVLHQPDDFHFPPPPPPLPPPPSPTPPPPSSPPS